MATPSAAFEALMNGVTSWDVPEDAVPCELLLIGEASFPVMVNDMGQVLIAASSYGRGRLVVMSHEDYLVEAQLTPFLLNAVGWLCSSPGAPIGVHPSLAPLAKILEGSGMDAKVEPEVKDSLGVYCIDAYNETMTEKLVKFMKRGGGLLIGGQAWDWANQGDDERVLFTFPGNLVTSVAGIYFTDNKGDTSFFKVSKKMPKIPVLVSCEDDLSEDREELLHGISELDISNSDCFPSQLLVHGALAFPLGLDSYHGCVIAAARYGRGRVVVTGHKVLFTVGKLGPFLLNAVRWLDGGRRGKIVVQTELRTLSGLLAVGGIDTSIEPNLTSDASVYCFEPVSEVGVKELQEFVAEGGGLFVGAQAWWWAFKNPGVSPLARFPGNLLLNPFGISITSQSLNPGPFRTPKAGIKTYHFRSTLAEFQVIMGRKRGNVEKGWLAKLGPDGAAFLQIPAEEIPAYMSVHRLLRKLLSRYRLPVATRENPVINDCCRGAMLSLATGLAHSGSDLSLLVPEIEDMYSSPYLRPSESPVTVEVNCTNPGTRYCWMSTGLYIPGRQIIEVSLPEAAASADLKIQIGCHTDDLTRASKLFRGPLVINRCCLDKPTKSITCLWGGLLYIIVPQNSKLGSVPVTVKGAVHAPYYKLGETTLEEWKRRIQENPGPWGELATDNIILTVPTANLRTLENPEPLLRLWDEVMQAVARLGAEPFPLRLPQRIVADVQISVGWMHAGYPIMCHLESVQELINEKLIRTKGLWGPVHELGRNQQRQEWEFPPHTTEATCNLWCVYVHETVLGIPRSRANIALWPPVREKRVRIYLSKGPNVKNWNAWTALETYLQLQEAFGWEPFIRLFTEYRNQTNLPTDNVDKMNLWVKMFSHQVQKNLAPFFEAWAWPIQKEVATSLAYLPEWKENIMKLYLLTQMPH
ncbi:TRPM8 channel-associated factor 1 isoform X1 [Trachypithecus francoisi]|uniref:TRPM8 channel-associated factor 1 isoform X1 n=2 Tax=Trachypithecus francoisi TaxID=54180 RepID=UPI00141B450D|nr:TRPM8 channel-associated factor 1 isoform X1 [Trachypithecus francoisi]XP_033047636.1 TRPM8 channel-associated factor 1 isoform X1 [Trachypithecus francoisi]XP_033047637.1 TRPM8 channel-associated factor 1 isoform X1 [Trachypithecus francoisi]XP_033047638.1 TRPM8 channel-associated factor 1 isoform X1 [Trachypithecus francoisi]XP_033047639.1 TRPM8 channel-associated factor 1 isoform X1 [Trachypithecus francoisi]XP_033047640.1 TRPM8 channel-associated factor 1 isoform X1 [Trachypithecus fran